MNSEKRFKQDNEITEVMLLDPDMPTHIIRSHRRARVALRRSITAMGLGCILLGILGSAYTPTATPERAARLVIITPTVVTPDVVVTPLPVPTVPPTVVPTPVAVAPTPVQPKPAVVNRIEIAIRYALAQQGDRYRWAASGPNTFDCSGLVMMAFKQIGISLPHFTGTMIARGKAVSRKNLKRGDILFPQHGHVAIYLGNNKMVDASSGKGRVTVETVYGFYAARRLI